MEILLRWSASQRQVCFLLFVHGDRTWRLVSIAHVIPVELISFVEVVNAKAWRLWFFYGVAVRKDGSFLQRDSVLVSSLFFWVCPNSLTASRFYFIFLTSWILGSRHMSFSWIFMLSRRFVRIIAVSVDPKANCPFLNRFTRAGLYESIR